MDLAYTRHMFNWPLWCVPYMECKPDSMIAKCHTRGPDYILAHCDCEVVRPLPSPAMVQPYLTIVLPKSSMACHTVTWPCPTMDRPYPTMVQHSPTMALPYSTMDHHRSPSPYHGSALLDHGSAWFYQDQPYSTKISLTLPGSALLYHGLALPYHGSALLYQDQP